MDNNNNMDLSSITQLLSWLNKVGSLGGGATTTASTGAVAAGTGLGSVLGIAGTTSMAVKMADQVLGSINGNLDTTNASGGGAMINNILASTLPGFSKLASTKVTQFKFDPNSSYTSLNKSYSKIQGEGNKSLMPWMTKSINKQGTNLLNQSNKIKALKTDFDNKSASISSDDLLTNYLNTVNPKNYNNVAIGKSGTKLLPMVSKNLMDSINSIGFMKDGGKMNLIPEGSLHARKHEINSEGLDNSITNKGIPIISKEEGGEIVQHAEIERNEIIFTLEVTKKLEKLAEEGSDEDAINAGKLLVEQILYNTDDRTGLLNEVEN